MGITVIQKIKERFSEISEEDIDTWAVPELMDYYKHRISFLAYRAYKSNSSSVATQAFEEQSRQRIRKALQTFIFKKEYWREGRDLSPYLLKSLKILSTEISWDQDVVKKKNVPVCPSCRVFRKREFLISENKLLRCPVCTQEAERLLKDIKDGEGTGHLHPRYRLCSVFALHSRKGYKCQECSRFIPLSANSKNGISCPYMNCSFFGDIHTLKEMSHPVGISINHDISLNQVQKNSETSGRELQEVFKSDNLAPDDILEMRSRTRREYKILLDVINSQVDCIKRTNSSSTITQKLLMYEAFKRMIDRYPEEMISYLVHLKQHADFPIQTRIFQTYVSLVENYLPFTMKKGGEEIPICSLTDRNLALFLGISKFDALVNSKHIVPNKTKEVYIGGRKFKNYGPCFVGDVIDVVAGDISLKNKIVEHGFQHITMDKSVPPGTKVTVTHFRIPSHYEMDSMVFLQRIRRHIVDAVYFRLNKKKRKTRARKCKQKKNMEN